VSLRRNAQLSALCEFQNLTGTRFASRATVPLQWCTRPPFAFCAVISFQVAARAVLRFSD
jgi:hypothetical protein